MWSDHDMSFEERLDYGWSHTTTVHIIVLHLWILLPYNSMFYTCGQQPGINRLPKQGDQLVVLTLSLLFASDEVQEKGNLITPFLELSLV